MGTRRCAARQVEASDWDTRESRRSAAERDHRYDDRSDSDSRENTANGNTTTGITLRNCHTSVTPVRQRRSAISTNVATRTVRMNARR